MEKSEMWRLLSSKWSREIDPDILRKNENARRNIASLISSGPEDLYNDDYEIDDDDW